MSVVSVENVWKYFGDYPALRSISFSVEAGQCMALLGRNGAGKTTLLRIMAGLSKAARGRVAIFGEDTREQRSRQKIGVLGHGIGLYDELTAYENLKLFAQLYGLPDPRGRRWSGCERTWLDHVKDALVREFSRGMRQRLAVARAFLHNPACCCSTNPSPHSTTAPSPAATVAARSSLARAARTSSCPPISCAKPWNWPHTSPDQARQALAPPACARRRCWMTPATFIAPTAQAQ
jgi:ABC-type transport system involved in cytochrome c biogenesis ATPase subunit